MKTMKTFLTVFVLIVFSITYLNLAFSQEELSSDIKDEDLEQELKWLKAETFVITASKVLENIKKAPASITVITDRQIRQMGAKHLNDVLNRTVPSFLSYPYIYGMYVPLVRSGNNVLTMVNSIPIYDLFWAVTPPGYDTLCIDNIKRIEIVRGPGSALYGANAYDGVINIITKTAEDVDGVELTAKGGSWDTQQYNLLFGKIFSELEVTFNFNYFKTHGYRAFIKEDQNTQYDRLWNSIGVPSNASLAPGRTKAGDEKYDAALTLKFKDFTLDGRYVDREWDIPFSPTYAALTEKTKTFEEDYYLSLSYKKAIRDGIELSGKVYRLHFEPSQDAQYAPPGIVTLIPDPTLPDTILYTWPEGLLVKWEDKASRTGIKIQSIIKVGDSNTIVAGATFEEQEYSTLKWWSNYLLTERPDVLEPLPSLQRAPYPNPINFEEDFKAVFLEDIWDITNDLRLVAGLRYDHYSHFGGHISPRIGLTWEYIKGYDLKLLYGHAFRAPTAGEINFKAPGSTLDPETVDTYEISLGAEFSSSFSGRLTFYYKKEKDLITGTSYFGDMIIFNKGTRREKAFEVEAKYGFGKGTYLAGNFLYGNWQDDDHRFLGKIMSNIRLSRHFNLYFDCQHHAGMSRPAGYLGDQYSYTYANATMIARKFLKGHEGLELGGSVYNLFDEDFAWYISDGLPYGWPQPGINFLVEMKYRF